jgi:hypothetical protein
VEIYTIGFTKKSAKEFFTTLPSSSRNYVTLNTSINPLIIRNHVYELLKNATPKEKRQFSENSSGKLSFFRIRQLSI